MARVRSRPGAGPRVGGGGVVVPGLHLFVSLGPHTRGRQRTATSFLLPILLDININTLHLEPHALRAQNSVPPPGSGAGWYQTRDNTSWSAPHAADSHASATPYRPPLPPRPRLPSPRPHLIPPPPPRLPPPPPWACTFGDDPPPTILCGLSPRLAGRPTTPPASTASGGRGRLVSEGLSTLFGVHEPASLLGTIEPFLRFSFSSANSLSASASSCCISASVSLSRASICEGL